MSIEKKVRLTLIEEHSLVHLEEGAIGKVWKSISDQHGLVRVNSAKTAKENTFQYLFNPFVDGPLKHLNASIKSGILNLLIKIFTTEKPSTVKELNKRLEEVGKGSGPYARQSMLLAEELRRKPELYRQLIDEHFIQWFLNPLVPGPIDKKRYERQVGLRKD